MSTTLYSLKISIKSKAKEFPTHPRIIIVFYKKVACTKAADFPYLLPSTVKGRNTTAVLS